MSLDYLRNEACGSFFAAMLTLFFAGIDFVFFIGSVADGQWMLALMLGGICLFAIVIIVSEAKRSVRLYVVANLRANS